MYWTPPSRPSTLLLSLVSQSLDPQAPLPVKRAAVGLLPSLLSVAPTSVVSANVEPTLLSRLGASLHSAPFPLRSTDLKSGTSEWRDYASLMEALLNAVVRSKSFPLLKLLAPKLSEKDHAYKEGIVHAVRLLLTAVNEVGKVEQPRKWSDQLMAFFTEAEPFDRPHMAARCWMADFVLVPLLRIAPMSVVRDFFQRNIASLWSRISAAELNTPAATSDTERLRLQAMRLESDWRLVEVLFRRERLAELKELFARVFAESDELQRETARSSAKDGQRACQEGQ